MTVGLPTAVLDHLVVADAITVRRATNRRSPGLSARIRTAAGVVRLD